MKKIRLLITCVAALLTYAIAGAQPKVKKLSDPVVVKYIVGGYAKDQKIHLTTNADYSTLSWEDKQNVLNKVVQDFAGYDITVHSGGQTRELWIADGNHIICIERWNNDSLKMENYTPAELNRNGYTKIFYYVGGTFNGGDGYSNGTLNLRGGSFLYRNIIDASLTANFGYNNTNGDSQFSGDIGIDSRVYLPFRIKELNLAPYTGAGVSYSFSPYSYFEFRLLAGSCWFVGPGSLDIGLQYGTKSNVSLTAGYTFHLPIKKKAKK